MSADGPLSGFRRVILGADALHPKDVQALEACKGHYEHTGCENYKRNSFEADPHPYYFTLDVRSSDPLTPQDLQNLRKEEHHGFLYKEARVIERRFKALQSFVLQNFLEAARPWLFIWVPWWWRKSGVFLLGRTWACGTCQMIRRRQSLKTEDISFGESSMTQSIVEA